ncbi:MAG: LuxR C-terminal-related transcriptional regulator [Eggerthellaceae bacterium]|jgi:DNA-binding CsgD family transcriptional regulator|nr:LuxR C-terminal-related transcriptional regulator [Eggerthellaceae bacterium]MDR2722084.1 LuxR C-terminal-related transcriptional regulator [Coriobacteriaceae bacterium]
MGAATTQYASNGSAQESLTKKPLKYLGFALLLAWHYCLWFVPRAFFHVPLLDDSVTYAWLINLAATVCALFVIAKLLGRKRHLSDYRWLYWAAPLLTGVATLVFLVVPQAFSIRAITFSLPFFLGITEAVMWILWGERYASIKANFSIKHIGMVFGLTLISTIAIASFLPPLVSSVFVALLPLVSGALLLYVTKEQKTQKVTYPPLLPKNTAKEGFRNLIVVCIISFAASTACYFLAAIIPWEILPTTEESFTVGIVGGAILILAISTICIAAANRINIFKLYPWLLVVEVIAFALFLAETSYYFPSFIMALAVSSVFEIFLIMYFGILTSKGYIPPVWAFSFSAGFIRAGILAGNSLAIFYELNPALAQAITPETCLVFIAILLALLIALVKQEYNIAALTSEPLSGDDLKRICNEITKEFSLSERESEILFLIASGRTADSIAKKLVISPHTANTHIRHIYEKTRIHKRSELLNYINMQRSDY